MKDLSIVIPSRNEMFLKRTIEDLLDHIEADTEIIAIADGAWPDPVIAQHPKVNVIFHSDSVGQRAAANEACRIATGKYIAKVDAHCSFDQGFDKKMLEGFAEVGDNVTMVPIMRNLWAFDWKCFTCGWKKYQGPTPEKCEQCGNELVYQGLDSPPEHLKKAIRRKMLWVGKKNPQSTSYCFDSEPHFQYFEDWKHRPQYESDKKEKGFTETMSLQGSFFMCTKEKYIELDLCSEMFGSWGNQGIEVAVKTWLSGGRVLVNHRTWYAHMFRTQGGDFSFPYPQSGREVAKTKTKVKDLFYNRKWDKAIYPLSWLIEKFWPVPGWDEAKLKDLKAKEDRQIGGKTSISYVEEKTDQQKEAEFRSQIDKKLCELGDLLMKHYNCCNMVGSNCKMGPIQCCIDSIHNLEGAKKGDLCPHWKDKCTFPNADCKLWLCEVALGTIDPKCAAALLHLQRFGDAMGVVTKPFNGEPYNNERR